MTIRLPRGAPPGGAVGRRLSSEGRRATRWDVVVTVLTLAVMATVVTVRSGPARYPGAELLAFTVVSWLPLIGRTRWPEPVLAAVVAVEASHLAVMRDLGASLPGSTVGAYQPVPIATMVAVYTVATRRRQRDGWLAGALAAFVLVGTALLFQPLRFAGTDLVMVQLIVIASGVGVGVRARHDSRQRRAHDARDQARQAVLDERLRIARELHDTLAHNLALVDAQAGVADYLLDTDPGAARQALRGITQHTAAAIDDLRATLVLLRQDPDEDTGVGQPDAGGVPAGNPARREDRFPPPVAGLAQLDGLLAGLRETGTAVTLDVRGQPAELSHQTDLAAFRIIQEALTNAAKHAPGAPVGVTLGWTPRRLNIEVRNRRASRAGNHGHRGTGHGLIGLRERARAAGGSFQAGPTDDGGFRVAAELRTRAHHAPDNPSHPAGDTAPPATEEPDP